MTENNLQLALYFLELLYSKGPLPINVLSEIYQNRLFLNQIIPFDIIVNETLYFLKQYPSLFQIDSDFVFPISNDNTCHSEPLPSNQNCTFFHSSRIINARRLSVDDNEIALESEAVKYFQKHLSKKEDRWIPIKSLAGHLSQASENIRKAVGNQSLFTAFLLRHSHVFEIQGELVGVKDIYISNKKISNAYNDKRKNKNGNDSRSVKSDDTSNSDSFKSKENFAIKKKSLKDYNQISNVSNILFNNVVKSVNGNSNGKNSVSVGISANDYKTVFFLREIIKSLEDNKKESSLANIMENIICGPSNNIKNTIGYTQIELEEYLSKHVLFFDIMDGGIVKCSEVNNVNIIITDNCNSESLPLECESTTLINREGFVYHISKLWGIIDLGQHEHVFFDKSIFKNIEDLQKYFQVGERIYFNAELAAKDSRAKWKATRVWKEADNPILQGALTKISGDGRYTSTPKLVMPDDIDFSDDEFNYEMLRDIKNGKGGAHHESEDENTMRSIVSIGLEEDGVFKSPTVSKATTLVVAGMVNGTVSVATQTLSTGEIMAKNFYHDDVA